MALPQDDPGAILKDALAPQQNAELAATSAMPVDPLQSDMIPPPDILSGPSTTQVDEPIKVAGMIDTIMKAAGNRVLQAEKKILPALKDEPVQMIGDHFVAKPLEQSEMDTLAAAAGGDYAKGINWQRITSNIQNGSLEPHVDTLRTMFDDMFEADRRGTLNFEALREKTKAKGADHYVSLWLKHPIGEGAAPEDILGGLEAAFSLSMENEAAWRAAKAVTDPEARTEAMNRAAAQSAIEAVMYSKISAAGSEAGRSLYVLSQASKFAAFDPASRGGEIAKLFNATDTKDIEYIGDAYLSLKDPDARQNFLKQGILSRSMDVMAEVYINSLLSNPKTHIVNIAGNTAFMATRILETALAGGIGAGRSAITGSTDRVYAREALAQLQGIKDGWLDALIVAGKTFTSEEGADIASKIDTRSRRAIGNNGDLADIYGEFRNGNAMAGAVNTLGVSIRMPGRFLLAEDEFFKGVGYRMFLHGEAEKSAMRVYDEVIAQGRPVNDALAAAGIERNRILTDPPETVIKTARDAAKEMTFQKGFEPGGFLDSMNSVLSHPIAKLFVPFFKTPTNISRAVLERSPIQFVNPAFYRTLAAGGRDADMAMAKVALGSSIMGAFAYKAMGTDDDSVIINGNGPSDPQAQDAWKRKGFLPYSISVKQDDGSYRSYTYSRFDPMSGVLAMAADFAYYAQHESDGKVLDDLATAATLSISNYMFDQPMAQGMSKLAAAFTIQDPKQKSEEILKIIGEAAGSGVGSFIPGNSALGAEITRQQDPVRRNTMLPEKGLFNEDPTQLPAFVKGFYMALQKAKAQNPFFNKDLPPAINEWAEPIQMTDGSAWNFMSPIKIQDTKFTPVDDEILRLGGGVSRTPKKISGVELNAVQYNRLLTVANQMDAFGRMPGDKGYDESKTMLPTLMTLISSKPYQAELPTKDDQQQALSNVIGQFRSAARQKLLQEDPYLAAKVAAQQ